MAPPSCAASACIAVDVVRVLDSPDRRLLAVVLSLGRLLSLWCRTRVLRGCSGEHAEIPLYGDPKVPSLRRSPCGPLGGTSVDQCRALPTLSLLASSPVAGREICQRPGTKQTPTILENSIEFGTAATVSISSPGEGLAVCCIDRGFLFVRFFFCGSAGGWRYGQWRACLPFLGSGGL